MPAVILNSVSLEATPYPAVAVLQVRIHEHLMDLQHCSEVEGVLDGLEPVGLLEPLASFNALALLPEYLRK